MDHIHWRKVVFWGLAAAVLSGLTWFAYNAYQFFRSDIPEAYAVIATANAIIEYMEGHDGAWPAGWDDLRRGQHVRDDNVERVRGLVEVDFDADPAELVKVEPPEDAPPFRVIWTRSGSNVHWESYEPNRMVWNYLRHQQSVKQGAKNP